MNFSKNIQLTILMLITGFNICIFSKNSSVTILNEYPEKISLQLIWRNEHGIHNRLNTTGIILKGRHNTFPAPLVGYSLDQIIAIPTKIAVEKGLTMGVASVGTLVGVGAGFTLGSNLLIATGSVEAGLLSGSAVQFKGKNKKAHQNSYFVITKNNNKNIKKNEPQLKVVITGYRNQAAYKASKEQTPAQEVISDSELAE